MDAKQHHDKQCGVAHLEVDSMLLHAIDEHTINVSHHLKRKVVFVNCWVNDAPVCASGATVSEAIRELLAKLTELVK